MICFQFFYSINQFSRLLTDGHTFHKKLGHEKIEKK